MLELALATDRAYMLASSQADAPTIVVSPANFGLYPTVAGKNRLHARFYGDESEISRIKRTLGKALTASEAVQLGLVTAAPDELD